MSGFIATTNLLDGASGASGASGDEDYAFFSDPILTNGADSYIGTVYANVAGTLYVDQGDGTNWDSTTEIEVPQAGASGESEDGFGFAVPIYGSVLRLRYINGDTDQTEFRIRAKLESAGVAGD